eukprot:724227-Prymnesium_polylepis.3
MPGQSCNCASQPDSPPLPLDLAKGAYRGRSACLRSVSSYAPLIPGLGAAVGGLTGKGANSASESCLAASPTCVLPCTRCTATPSMSPSPWDDPPAPTPALPLPSVMRSLATADWAAPSGSVQP